MLQLPIECIALTIEHIGECNDIETLLSLLLVSRAVSREAVAALYRNPFRFLTAEKSRSRGGEQGLDTQGCRAMSLLRLLARCLPDHLQSPFLKKILALELTSRPSSPSFGADADAAADAAAAAAAKGVTENRDASATSRCSRSYGGSNTQEDHSRQEIEQQQSGRLSGALREHQSATAFSAVDGGRMATKAKAGTTTPAGAALGHADHSGLFNFGCPSINYLSFLVQYDWVLFTTRIQFAIDCFCPWRPLFEIDEDPIQYAATYADVSDIQPGTDGFLEYTDQATDFQEPYYLMVCATAKLYIILRLEREMTWAICQLRLEALQSLKIPLRDIGRFQELVVQRGVHLQSLCFIAPWDAPVTDRRPEVWAKTGPLLQEHVRQHPGTLQQVHALSLWGTELTDQPGLSQYHHQWYKLLPPCSPPPTTINPDILKRVFPRWDETDYSKVTTIELLARLTARHDFGLVEAFLPKCRSLRNLEARLSANAFQWAVDEISREPFTGRLGSSTDYSCANGKRTQLYNGSNSNNNSNNNNNSNSSSSSFTSKKPFLLKPVPVPLTSLRCHTSIDDVQKIVQDATWAFHSTLTTVNIQVTREIPSVTPLLPPQANLLQPLSQISMAVQEGESRVTLGQDWKLDRLQRLQLTLEAPFLLDRSFLERCTDMQVLSLSDQSRDYNPATIVPCHFGQTRQRHNKKRQEQVEKEEEEKEEGERSRMGGALRKLRHLTLYGTPAVLFNPRVLQDAPHLCRLDLGWPDDHDMYFLTPVQDDELNLGEGDIDLGAMTGRVEKEFSYNTSGIPDVDDEAEEQEDKPMGSLFSAMRGWSWDWCLPSLRYLHLSGDWALRCRVRLLAGCPQLEELQMSVENRMRVIRHITIGDVQEALAMGRLRQGHALSRHAKLEQGEENNHHHHHEDRPSSSSALVLLPKLRKLDLFGPWHFEPGAFELLFLAVCPNLETMMVPSCRGFTAEELLDVTAKMPNLHFVNFPWLFEDEDDTDKYGLELIESYEWNTFRNNAMMASSSTAAAAKALTERAMDQRVLNPFDTPTKPQTIYNTMGLFYRRHSPEEWANYLDSV